MNIEKKPIVKQNGCWHIVLDELARPDTMRITLLGTEIKPRGFDYLGHPIFYEEQGLWFKFTKNDFSWRTAEPVLAEVQYEKAFFDTDPKTFNDVEGLEEAVEDLTSLNEVLKNRSIFHFLGGKLDKFLILRCFLLKDDGTYMSILKEDRKKLNSIDNVEIFSAWAIEDNCSFVNPKSGDGFVIPDPLEVCPFCGKRFNIQDLKTNPCVSFEGKTFHESCLGKLRKAAAIDKFIQENFTS